MAEEEKQEGEEKKCDRPLMCPEEWKEPSGRVVISEFHKEGAPVPPSEDADLDAFESYWRGKGAINFKSEYHKEGAPYMEAPSEWDGHRPRLGEVPDAEAEAKARETREQAHKRTVAEARAQAEAEGKPLPRSFDQMHRQRDVDVNALEIVTYAAFRALFGYGIKVPIKREGLVDMDIVVKNRDVVINTNQLYVSLPELAVWRVIYSHKGKPIMELGRGVKNGMKIHRYRGLLLLLEIWRNGRESRKLRERVHRETLKTSDAAGSK
ncbi:MAG TPA: hypothetical protein VMB46_01990 [Methanomassiliicoccales archaeon]|nr:hypothetical protein [Methanomassiliicoccales archaeon]